MNFQITNVNMRYAENELESVQVYFTGRSDDSSIDISGYIPLTSEEYAGNESIPILSNLVKEKVMEKLNYAE